MARDPSDELMNMRVIYGSPPEPSVVRQSRGLYCESCDNGKKLSGEKAGCPTCGRVFVDPKIVEELERTVAREKISQTFGGEKPFPADHPIRKDCGHCKNSLRFPFRPCDTHGAIPGGVRPVDDPPPYAGSDEIRIIALLETLDERARLRVIRYALSRWPVVGLGETE